MSARRPAAILARTVVNPSMSTRKAVPSKRRARAAARVDESIPRLSKASMAASHAGVGGMSDLVAAMKSDDSAGQVVIAGLRKTCAPQHVEQRLLIGMHANRLRQVAVARRILGDEAAEHR